MFESVSAMEIVGALLFAIAVLHTFSTRLFARLATAQPAHAGLWHLLAEVEVVFGFWAGVLVAVMLVWLGRDGTLEYLESRNFTEPAFVFAVMVIAASRPILQLITNTVDALARLLPMPTVTATCFLCLSLVPLLGSFITEPAAMTLAAIMLRDAILSRPVSNRLRYAVLGVLFVNVSIGGTLTHFAAPPVLMVAAKWQWDIGFMFATFGWKALLATLVNAAGVTLLFSRELASLERSAEAARASPPKPVPPLVTLIHLAFLAATVAFAHHPVFFIGLVLLFLGFVEAYNRHQDRLMLREGLLVAFFLAGLVTLGGLQRWWLQPLLADVEPTMLYFVATALTAITDNAALTYLGSLVEGTSDAYKYALVAGAVPGGGLTVIGNAPNPAGFAILKPTFKDEAISPLGLFAAATLPTFVAIIAFLA